jgi:hypothetical protein
MANYTTSAEGPFIDTILNVLNDMLGLQSIDYGLRASIHVTGGGVMPTVSISFEALMPVDWEPSKKESAVVVRYEDKDGQLIPLRVGAITPQAKRKTDRRVNEVVQPTTKEETSPSLTPVRRSVGSVRYVAIVVYV